MVESLRQASGDLRQSSKGFPCAKKRPNCELINRELKKRLFKGRLVGPFSNPRLTVKWVIWLNIIYFAPPYVIKLLEISLFFAIWLPEKFEENVVIQQSKFANNITHCQEEQDNGREAEDNKEMYKEL